MEPKGAKKEQGRSLAERKWELERPKCSLGDSNGPTKLGISEPMRAFGPKFTQYSWQMSGKGGRQPKNRDKNVGSRCEFLSFTLSLWTVGDLQPNINTDLSQWMSPASTATRPPIATVRAWQTITKLGPEVIWSQRGHVAKRKQSANPK